MTARTKPRSVFDTRTRMNLVFPDTLVLSGLARRASGGRELLTMVALMQATPLELAAYQSAREIRWENVQFSMQPPVDPRVASFDFARNSPLAATIGLLCDPGTADEVVACLHDDPTYLRPEYRGTTEEFVAAIEVAAADLVDKQIDSINALGRSFRVAEAITLLIQQLAAVATAPSRACDLADLVLAESAVFDIAAGPPRRVSLMLNACPPVHLSIVQEMPKTQLVVGRAPNIRVEVR